MGDKTEPNHRTAVTATSDPPFFEGPCTLPRSSPTCQLGDPAGPLFQQPASLATMASLALLAWGRCRAGWYCLVSHGVVLALLATSFNTACSHTTPYYGPGITPPPPRRLENQVAYRILLIGDAGEPKPREQVLDSLHRWVLKAPERTLVVFLGDNAYPEGLTPARQRDAQERLLRQLAAVKGTEATALFVPGNHDWANGKADGHAAVLRQEEFVRQFAEFLPRGGCPGPEFLDLPGVQPVTRLVALDTQWWLHDDAKPTSQCAAGSPVAVIASLKEALATDLPVIVAAHHPLATYGRHGGFFDWRDHLFPQTRVPGLRWFWLPLPGVGSLFPLVHTWNRSAQDLGSSANRTMRASLEQALASRAEEVKTPVIYVAGHDHNLQIIEGRVADYVLVSGLGSSSKATPVSHWRRHALRARASRLHVTGLH